MRRHARLPAVLAALMSALTLAAPRPAAADPMLAGFLYPHDVMSFELKAQGHLLSMAYMDVKPKTPNGRTVVLLHGKNFCGATWERVIAQLSNAGYRVVVPDQIGFCKSSKPGTYHYSLHELARNTRELIASLGIERPILAGHSMGGMLAMRYALSFPADLSGLVLVNPIGLEDWRAKGVPERSLDELFEAEKKTTAETIKAYQAKAYYHDAWKPEYDRWVDMLASMYEGDGGVQVAWAQALTSKMVFTDPVIHEIGRIEAPTVLLIGEKDRTAIGRDRVTPELAQSLGNYPELARGASAAMKNATLMTFPSLGHSPHVEDPDAFLAALLFQLSQMAGGSE